MTVSGMLSILKNLIDVSIVWILIYAVLKNLKNNVSKVNYEQRNYDNLDFLYANNSNIKGDLNG